MLAKLYDVKTVLPITAKRINNMEVGEVWKLPLVVRYSFGAKIGGNIAEVVNVSIGALRTRENKPSISLYKIDENSLRVRFRVDHVTIKSVGVEATTVEIPAGNIGVMSGEDLISTTINRTLAKEINKFIALKLGYTYVRVNGQKLLLEFYVDPKNPAQVEKLAEFLKGNLDTIENFIKLGLRFNQFSEETSSSRGVGELEELAAAQGSAIEASNTFAGSDHYTANGHNINVNIPVAHSQESSWVASYHRYQALNNNGEVIHVQQQTRTSKGESLNVPLAGTVIKRNSTKDIYVVNKEGTDGKASRPVLLYQNLEGFVRQGDPAARHMIDNANNVLKYAGRKGEGVDMSNTLPSAGIFPPPPGSNDLETDPAKTYHSAAMSFKLVFAEQAVQDIVFAPTQMIMKSFMNVMRENESEREVVNKTMDLFTINTRGEVSYDHEAMAKRLGVNQLDPQDNGTNPLKIVNTLAGAATKFIAKITSVKEETTWKGQSERLAKVAASGDMKYEDFLKVVIQMVDVKNLSSEIYVHTDKREKGEADISQNYTMFNTREHGFDNTISAAAQMRDRFAEPSDLTD
jgi:hypothetical protein